MIPFPSQCNNHPYPKQSCQTTATQILKWTQNTYSHANVSSILIQTGWSKYPLVHLVFFSIRTYTPSKIVGPFTKQAMNCCITALASFLAEATNLAERREISFHFIRWVDFLFDNSIYDKIAETNGCGIMEYLILKAVSA